MDLQLENLGSTPVERRIFGKLATLLAIVVATAGLAGTGVLAYARVVGQTLALETQLQAHRQAQEKEEEYREETLDAIFTHLQFQEQAVRALCANSKARCPTREEVSTWPSRRR